MKIKPVKPAPAAPFTHVAPRRGKKPAGPPATNHALNAQSRRVLAQHYRAKYGVK
jgi:hypothetical protein